ncbi:MAG: TIR domain-containing protein, partial [Chloroflexota bacterium]|nr:TIR domain-containing protein [Chloroflexota bacterium]
MHALAANLHRAGFEVFLDEWELVGGDRVTGRLEDAIKASKNGVLVVSPHSLSRPWVREEYEALLRQAVHDASRRLIPVLYLDAELPAFMANRLWVDFRTATTGPAYDAALDRLGRYLRGEAGNDRPERDSARQWPTGPGGERVRPAGPIRLSLVIEKSTVSLRADGRELARSAARLRPATVEAVKSLHRLWHQPPLTWGSTSGGEPHDAMLADVGRRLSGDLLTGDVAVALAESVSQATELGEILELGVRAGELSDLPLETLQLPDADGTVPEVGGTPLVLHRSVALFREVASARAVVAHKVPGPLRVLVAIASPESDNEAGELLNYEAELARIVAIVDPARRDATAHVRVLVEGSLDAISTALRSEREGFHVLHVSCHARAGELVLEKPDGRQHAVSAQRLLDDAIPAGADLPMIVLSGCSTGLATRLERADDAGDGGGQDQGEQALGAVAEQLLKGGLSAVVAMQAPVSDVYATDVVARMYEHLATTRGAPDPLIALSQARRAAEQARQQLPADAPHRGRAEWATPALWVRGLRLPLYNHNESPGPVASISAPVLAEGIVVRKVGEFVGRRHELRIARRALAAGKPGLVIHGIGGVGKSTLAAELITSAAEQRLVVSLRGAISIDQILDEIGAQLTLHLPHDQAQLTRLRNAASALRVGDVEWTERWRLLAEVILPAVPILVLLDNFEDNLQAEDTEWVVRDSELADLLGRWARRPATSMLLVTSRHPFELPDRAHRRTDRLHLGPLSPAETAKLVWQLPGLDALSEDERMRAYRNVGGHPRTLEYLDALLQGGRARFADIAERMEERLTKRGISHPEAWLATRERNLDSTLAEAVTLAVDDVVLGDL